MEPGKPIPKGTSSNGVWIEETSEITLKDFRQLELRLQRKDIGTYTQHNNKEERKMGSGKSASKEHPKGIRRTDKDGNELAPRSLWRKGKRYLKSCSQRQLEKLGLWEEKDTEGGK